MGGIRWTETFAGWLAFEPVTDYNGALMAGAKYQTSASLNLSLEDLDEWINDPGYAGRVRGGTITCDGLDGGAATIEDGDFWLFVPANEELPDPLHLRMRYRLSLRLADTNAPLTLHAFKLIENDPGFDSWSDTTTLFTRIYRGERVPADADQPAPLATGILRIGPLAFLRALASFSGTDGSAAEQVSNVLRYQWWFLRRLARAYVGPAVRHARPSFPVDRPEPGWGIPERELDWRPVPGVQALERKIIPFEVEDLDFPLNVQRLRRAGAGEPAGDPVLLIPGSGVRANMYYGQPAGTSLAGYLLDRGYDVWVENWRASIDFPPNRYTLDQAARIDHPTAVDVVLERTQPPEGRLRAVVHCQGSVGFLMAYVAGFLDDKLTHVVSSAVSLFIEVKWATWLKQRAAIPVVKLMLPWMDAQWGLRSDTPQGAWFGALSKWMERPCGNPACQVANFMYGSGWDTLLRHHDPDGGMWVHDDVHTWSARELGATPMTLIDQIAESSRYGHIVPAQPRDPYVPANYLAPPPASRRQSSPPRFTFVAGDENQMFRWEGQQKAAKFMERFHGCPADFVGVSGFGHLDTIWGVRAPDDVFPVIEDGLRWDGLSPRPSEVAEQRRRRNGGGPEMNGSFPPRDGRLPRYVAAARKMTARG